MGSPASLVPKSIPLYEVNALLPASTLMAEALGNSWKKPGSMVVTEAGMEMLVMPGAFWASV
ncbi:hypothetical protein [Adlercreutzia murintestinalis]|uniref:hypothetical protein n=1 Tax=Adlercreutzia murintestinalis TaxID=2941325 RepID=UPI00203CA1D1|nr:hypothetical protein [Adlercreutzia murintestinalis]